MTGLAMSGGSRPATRQPAAAAQSDTPTTASARVENRHVAQVAEVVAVQRRERDVGADDAEERNRRCGTTAKAAAAARPMLIREHSSAAMVTFPGAVKDT